MYLSRIAWFANASAACVQVQRILSDGQIDEESIKKLKGTITIISTQLKTIGLTQTVIYADRFARDIDGLPKDEIIKRFDLLCERMTDELESIQMLYLSPREFARYEKTELFGAQFKSAFPIANGEIVEAGNCFALGRYTACVFHLMRATEVGLKVLFTGLSLPPLKESTWNWGNVLSKIDAEIKRRNAISPKDPKWESEKHFYEEAHAFLAAAKTPIRNSTMHVASNYDEAGAEIVFNGINAFMSHLATKLKE